MKTMARRCQAGARRRVGIIATRNSDGDTDFAVRLRMDNGDAISLLEGRTRQCAETCLEAFERAWGKRFGDPLGNTPPPASPVPPVFAPIEHGELQRLREQRDIYWVLPGLALLTAVLVTAGLFYDVEWLLVLAFFTGIFAVNLVAGARGAWEFNFTVNLPRSGSPQRTATPWADSFPGVVHHSMTVRLDKWEPTEGTFAAEAYFLKHSAGPVLVVTEEGLLKPPSKPRKSGK